MAEDFETVVRNYERSPEDSAGSSHQGLEQPAGSPIEPPAARQTADSFSTRGDFTEGPVPAQFKLPADLVTSLKLHSFQTGRSMSDIVTECLTSSALIEKAWVASRKAKRSA